MMLRTVLCAALTLVVTASAMGQSKKLSVGDAAPGLDIEKWVKNKETTIQPGNVYVVEFWATWCGPCRQSIPHLTKLQKEYGDKGLTIIGVSDERPDVVQKFVRSQGGKMDYTVAVDRSQSTNRAWMQAAGLNGIPSAFVVDRRSKIAFIGHPLSEEFESAIKKVLTGRFDAKLEAEAEPVLRAARSARKLRNWRLASRHYEEVLGLDSNVFASIGLEQFEMLLVDMNDRLQAYDFARRLISKEFATDAGALQMLAEKIVVDSKIVPESRDLDVALEAAEASRRVAGSSDPVAMAAVAQVLFHKGSVDQAIELQRQAYFTAVPKQKPDFQRVLRAYQDSASRTSQGSSSVGSPS